jgi:hypothetical protein
VADWLRRLFRRYIVDDVPNELSACLECGAIHCSESEFRNCPHRLQRVAALEALRERTEQEFGSTPVSKAE